MAATLAEIRDAIKATIAGIEGLRAYDTAPDKPEFPCAVVIPVDAEFDKTFGKGFDMYTFDIDVMTQGVSDRAGQDALDDLITGYGDRSIRAAIWASDPLGLVATTSRLEGFRDYGSYINAESARYFRAVLRLVVHTSGV